MYISERNDKRDYGQLCVCSVSHGKINGYSTASLKKG